MSLGIVLCDIYTCGPEATPQYQLWTFAKMLAALALVSVTFGPNSGIYCVVYDDK